MNRSKLKMLCKYSKFELYSYDVLPGAVVPYIRKLKIKYLTSSDIS
jgi:hypothetical protein